MMHIDDPCMYRRSCLKEIETMIADEMKVGDSRCMFVVFVRYDFGLKMEISVLCFRVNCN
jgi:hypothetical protein